MLLELEYLPEDLDGANSLLPLRQGPLEPIVDHWSEASRWVLARESCLLAKIQSLTLGILSPFEYSHVSYTTDILVCQLTLHAVTLVFFLASNELDILLQVRQV